SPSTRISLQSPKQDGGSRTGHLDERFSLLSPGTAWFHHEKGRVIIEKAGGEVPTVMQALYKIVGLHVRKRKAERSPSTPGSTQYKAPQRRLFFSSCPPLRLRNPPYVLTTRLAHTGPRDTAGSDLSESPRDGRGA